MATTGKAGVERAGIEDASEGELRALIARAKEELKEREREVREEKKAAKKAERGKSRQEAVGERVNTGNGSYVWEQVICGESTCKCASGQGHGPYLYIRGVLNDPNPPKGKPRKSIYIPLKDVHKHPDAPPRPVLGDS